MIKNNRIPNFLLHGDVIWLQQDILNADPLIHKTAPIRTSGGKRPFVVDHSGNGRACVAPLTRSPGKGGRLWIAPSWRRGGDFKWHHGDIYLNDGANTFEGPEVALRRAYCGNGITWTKYGWITAEGMEAIRREIGFYRPEAS